MLADVFREQALERGTAPALEFNGRVTTFAALNRHSNQVGHALIASRVRPGDRVAILSRNCARFFEVLGGSAKVRACLAPINFRLGVAEIAFILKDMAPKVLFVSCEFLELAHQASTKLAEQPELVILDSDLDEYPRYERWRDSASDNDPGLTQQPQDDLVLLYTSGTTGQPKGVRITNYNYQAILDAVPRVAGFSYPPGQTIANTMPLFHIAGINAGMSGLAQGCKVIPISSFVPSSFLGMIETLQVNYAFLAPSMIVSLLHASRSSRINTSSLKMIAYGAAPISADVLARAKERFGCEFAELYGLTESAGAGTTLAAAAELALRKPGSCGIPWPGMSVRVVDSEGNDVPAGTVGEIVMSGAYITAGYRNRPDVTASTIRDRWLYTGDAGFIDSDGYLFIRDRIKDLILSGAENIFPAEVENAISGCPGVADVAVIGVPSERWGEEVKAIVVPAAGAELTAAEIISWTKKQIGSYKAPKSVEFVSTLPRNAAGKVLRRELRRPYWEGRDRQIN